MRGSRFHVGVAEVTGQAIGSKTSVNSYQLTAHNSPEERITQSVIVLALYEQWLCSK